jgi:hypothetical protein
MLIIQDGDILGKAVICFGRYYYYYYYYGSTALC